ncbi:conserved hypothetical protein [Ricinus communis]|uniref:Uncharacterized protein n=1 Tax=Ricinus communis TaxID=3988 RepID=B9RRR7_RICCO|nr:conserved hypothetical protein [Ricinus communis]
MLWTPSRQGAKLVNLLGLEKGAEAGAWAGVNKIGGKTFNFKWKCGTHEYD